MLNNYRNDIAADVFTKERLFCDSISFEKSEIVNKIVWGGEVAVWNKIYKTERAAKLYQLIQGYQNVIYCDDQLLNVGYISLAGGVQAVIKDIAIYYHRKEAGVTSIQYSAKQFMDLQTRMAFYYEKRDELDLKEKLKSKILYSYIRNFGGAYRKFDLNVIKDNMSERTFQILKQIPMTIAPHSVKDLIGLIFFRLVYMLMQIKKTK